MNRFALGIASLTILALLGGSGCDDGNGTGGTTSSSGSGTTSTGTSMGGGGGADAGPFKTPDAEWTYVDFPDARCMDDTPTGIAVNLTNKSSDVFIYLEGGNACFNTVSCAITKNVKTGYHQAQFDTQKPELEKELIFSRTDATNPFKDFNYIYVPYCTGDVHGGDAANVMVAGKPRNFHGYKNLDLYLDRILKTWPTAGNVVLSGFSAGGFGAAYNYDHVAKRFGTTKVTLIDDSGPPMAKDFVAPCLQKFLFDLWGLKNTVPQGCADCAPADGVFMEPLVKYITTTYQDRYLTLLSGTEDATIASFWAFGNDNCANLMSTPTDYAGSLYAAGLADLRDRIAGADPNFYTYYVDGTDPGQDKTRHVWTDDPVGVSSHGVLLLDWLKQVVNNDPMLVSVPPKMPTP
jgi:hypothetical protein